MDDFRDLHKAPHRCRIGLWSDLTMCVWKRAERGSNRASRKRGKLHDPQSNARICTTNPDHSWGDTTCSWRTWITCLRGFEPYQHPSWSEVYGQLADIEPHLQLQERVLTLGRRQKRCSIGISTSGGSAPTPVLNYFEQLRERILWLACSWMTKTCSRPVTMQNLQSITRSQGCKNLEWATWWWTESDSKGISPLRRWISARNLTKMCRFLISKQFEITVWPSCLYN